MFGASLSEMNGPVEAALSGAEKGSIRNIPHDLLEKAELEQLYEKYEIKDQRTHRNKVKLGQWHSMMSDAEAEMRA